MDEAIGRLFERLGELGAEEQLADAHRVGDHRGGCMAQGLIGCMLDVEYPLHRRKELVQILARAGAVQVRRAFEGGHQGARVLVEKLRESGKGTHRASVSNEQHQQKRALLQGIGGVVGGVEATEHDGRLVRRADLRPRLVEQRIGFALPTRGALGQPTGGSSGVRWPAYHEGMQGAGDLLDI